MNIYETLKALSSGQQTLRCVGKIGTTLPHQADANRTVKDTFDRGGSMWGAKLAKNKPEIYLTFRDNKTHDSETDSFDWTSIVVSMFRAGRFELVNNPFEARLTRKIYDQLVEAKVCKPNSDLSKPILLDFRNMASFPIRDFDQDYLEDKISLMGFEAKLKDLNYLKTAAVDYARKNGLDWAPAKKFRASHPEYVTVSIPTTSYKVEVEGLTVSSSVNKNDYRTKEGRGFVYTEETYNRLLEEIETCKEMVKVSTEEVRMIELCALEHFGWTGGKEITTKGEEPQTYRVIQILSPDIEDKRCSNEDAQKFIKSNPHAFISKVPAVAGVFPDLTTQNADTPAEGVEAMNAY